MGKEGQDTNERGKGKNRQRRPPAASSSAGHKSRGCFDHLSEPREQPGWTQRPVDSVREESSMDYDRSVRAQGS